jgi:hypothetical protein
MSLVVIFHLPSMKRESSDGIYDSVDVSNLDFMLAQREDQTL